MNEFKQKLIEISTSILNASRNELYLSMRFLDIALSGLGYELNLSSLYVGTDGEKIYYNPRYLTNAYESDRVLVNRAYLHMILHCIFRHMLNQKDREEEYWNLACDIAIESMIDSMDYRAIKLTVSDKRTEVYEDLRQKLKVLTAEGIYEKLQELSLSELAFQKLAEIFWVDDHVFWISNKDNEEPEGNGSNDNENESDNQNNDNDSSGNDNSKNESKEDKNDSGQKKSKEQMQEMQDKWQDISEKMKTNLETISKEIGEEAGDILAYITVENRERYDYKSFLQKFVTSKEDMQVDDDAYDYVFYTYGLQLYGNMPLIESLEFKEVNKVEELVIAIDTSESCSDGLIKDFLGETYSLLRSRENFFKKTNIHIVQCDAEIQMDQVITCEEDLKAYMDDFAVRGSGGTDFRPVFEYVNKLIEKKSFKNLKSLIYFTDGYGQFPKKRPNYDTAFVFMQEDYTDVGVPPWAIKLILEPEDLMKRNNRT